MKFSRALPIFAIALGLSAATSAGPFPPAAGQTGSTAIAASDSGIVGWASQFENYVNGGNVDAQFQTPEKSLNEAGNSNGNNEGFTYDIVSLGAGGSVTLLFELPITNGTGSDFAVFENSFSDSFLELAYVEVSSNGTDFFRFPVASLTANPVAGFGSIDPTDISGFAGKYRGGFGTPFDLDSLEDDPLLDKTLITHVRIVDVIGDGSDIDDTVLDNPIYDPYPTAISGGFDLDAIAVMHFADLPAHNVPIPGLFIVFLLGLLSTVFKSPRSRS